MKTTTMPFFFLDGKTVLVESDLNYDNNLKGRKNFTPYEGSHHQIFKMLFPNDYGITEKSAGVHYYKATADTEKSIITDWEEQAIHPAAAILLPRCLIEKECFCLGLDKTECLNKIYYPMVYERYAALSDFRCSKKAPGYTNETAWTSLHKDYLDNPFDYLAVYPRCIRFDKTGTESNRQRCKRQNGVSLIKSHDDDRKH